METQELLDVITKEIMLLRELMYDVSEQVDDLNNPLLVKVSMLLDLKLNQQYQLKSKLYDGNEFVRQIS